MPLEQRVLQPIYVSRGIIDEHKNIYNLLPNELECFANETMVNMIKQLSSLSLYAEDLFGSILQDAGNLIIRTNTLQQKVDNLTIRVTQLDSTNDDISLHDIHLKKPYKPPNDTVQEIFSKKTLPKSVLELYYQCSKPPPLHLLNPFRDDGKDSMKFYTNPHFFFELWREVMLKKVEKEKNNKKLAQRPASKMHNNSDKERKPRQPANTNERFRKMISQQEFLVGDDINNKNIIYMTSNEVHHGQYNNLNDKQADVYGTYNGTVNHQGHYYSTNNFNPPSYYGTVKNGNYSQQITGDYVDNKVIQNNINNSTKKNYQNHPNQQNNVPYHLQQNHHHQMNGNYADSLTPPPPYNQLNQQDHNNHLQNSLQTLSKRSNLIANRPSQPPPQPPPINGNMNHEYHQPNGYVNHYSETNLNPQNLNNINSQNELLNSKARSTSLSRDVLPPPPPIPNANNETSNNILPPPPPSAMTMHSTNGLVLQNKKSPDVMTNTVVAPPPPPPPPPMPSSDVTEEVKPSVSSAKTVKKTVEFSFEQEILQKHKQLQPPKIINKPGPVSDPRNDLLASIREGIKLRRVEDSKQKEVEKSNLLDVASILARRVAMELSDSETEASDNSESDGWDDETEC